MSNEENESNKKKSMSKGVFYPVPPVFKKIICDSNLVKNNKIVNPQKDIVANNKEAFRAELFFAIERVVPEAFQSLENDVLPFYLEAYYPKSQKKRKAIRELVQVGNSVEELAFREALIKWSNIRHLDTPWALNLACHMLFTWLGSRKVPKKIVSLPAGRISDLPAIEPFTVEPWEPWELWGESEKEFNLRVQEALTKYKNYVKTSFKNAGWEETQKKRSTSGHHFLHFDWLALYQVGEWSQREIADRYFQVDSSSSWEDDRRKTVNSGINDAARLCGMTPREPLNVGRPRKE